MAAGAAVKMRIWDLHDSNYAKTKGWPSLIERIGFGASRNVTLINIRFDADFPTTEAEISTPNAVFDGTGTAVKVHVVSDSADDDGTSETPGTGCRSIILIGIDSTDSIIYEIILTNGVTGVASVNTYKRLFHAYPLTFGSGGDPAGNITVTNVAEDATYLTIAAGEFDSDGSRLWVPEDYDLCLLQINLGLNKKATTERLSIKMAETNADISTFDYIFYSTQSSLIVEPAYVTEQNDAEREIQFKIATLADAAVKGYVDIWAAIVPMTNALRGVPT
jgi:hypothetical protein